MSTNSLDYIQGWYRSLVNGSKQNTYKLALGLSLIECARHKLKKSSGNEINVSYSDLTDHWVKYYWDHTSVFKLRQSVNPNRPPEIISLIKKFIIESELQGVFWKKVDSNLKLDLNTTVSKNSGFIDNPISRLPFDHKTLHPGGDKEGTCLFYSWSKADKNITLSKGFCKTISTHFPLLQDIAVLAWASFIEQFNTVPGLIQKIKLENPKRKLSTIRKLFFEHNNLFDMTKCHYCEKKSDLALDHIVPFSFVFSDDVFNLVPACQSCNSSKSDRFPKKFYVNAATERNLILTKYDLKGKFPFKIGDESTVKKLLPNLVSQAKAAGFQEWRGPF